MIRLESLGIVQQDSIPAIHFLILRPIVSIPDFVARLKDGRILVVEYKGADRWTNDDSKEKRAIGELWATRSNGRCVFIMPKGPDGSALSAAIGS